MNALPTILSSHLIAIVIFLSVEIKIQTYLLLKKYNYARAHHTHRFENKKNDIVLMVLVVHRNKKIPTMVISFYLSIRLRIHLEQRERFTDSTIKDYETLRI